MPTFPVMLKKSDRLATQRFQGRIAIIASRYNHEYVDGLVAAATEVLKPSGAILEVFRVPGAFEIPVTASALLERDDCEPDAIICLGLIWQGETNHAQQIGQAVTQALMELSWTTGVPIIHEVITVTTEAQAKARCLDKATNRGTEAAQTALAMVETLQSIREEAENLSEPPPEPTKGRRHNR